MQPFKKHRGLVVPMLQANIDTDQIIPKQFLKRTERTGYGAFLFFDWRYDAGGQPLPGFVLNHPAMKEASVLLAGRNFGCGSSREHAAWALYDYGFRVVIAPSFGDIFMTNAGKNGILTLTLPEEEIKYLTERSAQNPSGSNGPSVPNNGYHLLVDLESCQVSDDSGWRAAFSVDEHRRHCLLEGLDEIGATLLFEPKIAAFEKNRAR